MTTEELKIAYKVISEIMETEKMNYDNSFVRVKNWIANKICNKLIDNKEN